MNRRDFLSLSVSTGLFLPTAMAHANTGPIRVVVGFPPGGSVDVLGRLTASVLARATGKPAVIDNRPGAAGRIAVEHVKAAAADGHTLLVSPQGPMTLFPYVFKNLRYDPAVDFTPIARLGISDIALSVGPAVPARDMAGLREWLRTAGKNAAFGSPGAGTVIHFAGLAVAEKLGIQMTHVPYQGSAKSMIDLAGGSIAMVFSPVTEALELHKAGRVRILATLGSARSAFVPDVPTLRELGHDIEVQGWNAVYGPAGLPRDVVAAYRAAIDKSLTEPGVRQQMEGQGVQPAPLGPNELIALRRSEAALWERVVRNSGFTSET